MLSYRTMSVSGKIGLALVVGALATQARFADAAPNSASDWWFDGPSGTAVGIVADRIQARALSAEPGVTYGAGPSIEQTAAQFRGTPQCLVYADSEHSLELGPEAAFTVEAWINPASKGVLHFVGKDVGPKKSSWWFRVSQGALEFLIESPDGKLVKLTGPANVAVGKWQHAAAVYDPASRKVALFLDGRKQIEGPIVIAAASQATTPFRVGCANYGADGQNRNFNGSIARVRVEIGRALAPSEFHGFSPGYGAGFR